MAAGSDQHIVDCGGHAGAVLHPFGHGLSQLIRARHGGISGVAAKRRFVHRVQDVGVCADIMFTDGKFGDGDAGLDHLAGFQIEAPAVMAVVQKGGDAV